LKHELALIERLDFARYFLTVHDIVAYARSLDPPILCQGRGSAANSAVCYCLGITAVDPATSDLLFERFISEERREPPDIDVDFEHERREEVIQHIYEKYGRDRAGIAATVIHYRPRSAIREVGKVMGLSEDVCGALASTIWGHMEAELEDARANDAGLDLSDPHLKRTVKLAGQLIGMPRHLSQHVGGFILTERPLTETVPIGNGAMDDRTFIEWDKDDIDELGILKIDVLALGMLTCIRKCFDLIAEHNGERWELATIPQEVPEVYDMLCRGDSLGVFQVESRAQMNMLPRLKPRCFYDLVIEVAIVRPGPIQGDMVHPYLKRRSGKEAVTFPCPDPAHGPVRRAREDSRPDARSPDLPGAGDEDRARCGKIQLGGSEPAPKGDGDLPIQGQHRGASGQDGRADGRARLRPPISPSAASTRSRVSANMAFPKATRRASRISSTCRAGSNGNIPRPSQPRSSIRSRWAFTLRRRSSATRASMGSRCARWM
jgi:DNA polymerase III alpha subunit